MLPSRADSSGRGASPQRSGRSSLPATGNRWSTQTHGNGCSPTPRRPSARCARSTVASGIHQHYFINSRRMTPLSR